MSRHVRAKAPRRATRPELSVAVNVPQLAVAAPLCGDAQSEAAMVRETGFSRLPSAAGAPIADVFVVFGNDAFDGGVFFRVLTLARGSASRAHTHTRMQTATWVNTSPGAQATAPAALNPRAWPASAISLQHPPRAQPASYGAQDRTRHQSLGAVMQAPAPQPVPLYSIPPGPTALSPSPYMLGRTASASAATISRTPRETRGRRRGASVSQLQQFHSPHPVAPQASTSAAYYHHHGHTFPPTSHSAPASHAPSPKRSLPPRPAIPSIPRAPSQPGTSRPPVAYSHSQIHGWYSPESSPSTIRRDSFDSAPSVWATPESQPGRRLSGATCVSSGTFGV
ncbi:hypothetical protein AURDEDRAFT_174823 [Auricularia subglabra TFB-10046 SS5]|nr:hypothetical protein AURDEDRAFT_174823 [Auricularia subglabra TFB-10046 SS5]